LTQSGYSRGEGALDRSLRGNQYRRTIRGSSLGSVRTIAAITAIAIAVPLAARAKPEGEFALIVKGDADQTDPCIDGQYVVYASKAPGGDWDILKYELGAAAPEPVADGLGNQDQPDVSRTTVVFRDPDGIRISSWDVPAPVRVPPHDPEEAASTVPAQACAYGVRVSNPTIGEDPVTHEQVAAWECGEEGSRDIAVFRAGLEKAEYLLSRPGPGNTTAGDQHAPAAFGLLLAFVDDGDGGSVWLHDSHPDPLLRSTSQVCEGHATGVAVGSVGNRTVLAVARGPHAGGDHDIEIWDAEGLVTALRVTGQQQNPHLSLDWVAFEDLSTGHSQIVLWQWTSGIVFVPYPSTSNQTLNDVQAVPGSEVRVVFADDGGNTDGSHDIALYRLRYEEDGSLPDDGSGSGWPWGPPTLPPAERPPPVSCDDPDPVVLATLVLGRDPGRPLAGSADLVATPFPGDAVLPVLVCIDSDRVSSAWVAFDDQAVAMPGDFEPHVTRLEIAAVAEGGEARISGVVAGRPGTSLVARVLADPGRIQGGPMLRRVPAGAFSGGGSGGCGTGGGAASLSVLAVLGALRRQRRR